MAERQIFKLKTIKKKGTAPSAGSTDNQPNTLYVQQVSDTEAKALVTDSKGKAVALQGGSGGTLKEIVEKSDYVPKPLQFFYEWDNNFDEANQPKTKGSNVAAVGAYYPSYDMGFGSYNAENIGKRNQSYNVWFGLEAFKANVTGAYNTIFGSFAANKLTSGSRNVIIGHNAGINLAEANAMTIVGANAGAGLNYKDRKGKDDLVSISPVFEDYLTGKNKWMAQIYFGYNSTDNTISPSCTSTIVGASAMEPAALGMRMVGSVVIGTVRGDNTVFRCYNNIFMGNFMFTNRGQTQVHNSVLIGNHFNLHNADNILAIHNDKNQRIAPHEGLIFGKFDERTLKINGSFSIDPARNEVLTEHTTENFAVINNDGAVKQVSLETLKKLTAPKHKLNGKVVSFIGDSITTFGTTTKDHYKGNNYDIAAYEETWTGSILKQTGGVLGTLEAFAGSRVTGTTGDSWAYGRSETLKPETEYILIMMGTNDVNAVTVPLGEIKQKNTFGDVTNNVNPAYGNFTQSYQIGIERALKKYPNAVMVLLTPLKAFHEGSQDDRSPVLDKFSERIIELAKYYGIKHIDMRGLGLHNYNHPQYLLDGLHPNKAGMKLIADYVSEQLNLI